MKRIKILMGFLALLAICGVVACSKSHTPVDQIVELFNNATKKVEKIQNVDEIGNVNNFISREQIWKIIDENSDYKLTDGDKDKLKKSFSKLLKTAFEKAIQDGVTEPQKKILEAQIEMMIAAIDTSIDQAETLGEVRVLQ